ncbi:MAG: hypothetical protein MUF71_01940 [Candidatus Kapabacteria bacterium]|nr:hypothetical protein [Candidatus Kapabacteria bacterium]
MTKINYILQNAVRKSSVFIADSEIIDTITAAKLSNLQILEMFPEIFIFASLSPKNNQSRHEPVRIRTLTSSSLSNANAKGGMKGTIRGGSFLSGQRLRSCLLLIISLASSIPADPYLKPFLA